MKMMCYILCAAFLIIVACDGGAIQKPGADINTNDADQAATGDELVNDDGQLVNDDGQLVNDDGQLVNDDGQVVNDDGQVVNDDDAIITDETKPDSDIPVGDCLLNKDCDPTELCQKAAGLCNEGTGSCEARPEGCPEVYAPVCGCDEVTYENECMAHSYGVNVLYEGECGSTNSCGSNSDCSEFEYCVKPDGTCDAFLAGECGARPTEQECWMYSAIIEVCGCDNVTYQHPCFAAAAGVNIAYEGECGTVVTCTTNEECGDFAPMLCQKATGVCENGTGTCVTPETGCNMIYAPVCGCDGQTYDNECIAHANFTNVSYEGECGGGEGCYSNEECPGEPNGGKGFCRFDYGTCYGPGTCGTIPVACDDMYAPVCGCDGNTYSNECLANSNGVSVNYEGECGGENKYSTLSYYYDQKTDEPPIASVIIVNGEQTVTFEGADLITRTPFNGGVTLGTTFYGPDGGGVINLLLTLYSNGFSLPYTVTLDGSENYAQWTNFYGGGPTQLLGNLYGEVTVSQYQRDSNGTVTLIELSGEMLTYTPN